MSWHIAKASFIGGRREQQDRVTILSAASGVSHLVVVADGMGGHKQGALAAQKVVDTAESLFFNSPLSDPVDILRELCFNAHREIQNIDKRERPFPGSTIVAAYLTKHHAWWAHIGDSRLYHIQNGEVRERTLDHSIAQLLVTRGEIDEGDLATSKFQNQLYMSLGGEQEPQPEFGYSKLDSGDILVLCTDGFWSDVTPAEITDAVATDGLNDEVVEKLAELATERGGQKGDNCTIAIAQYTKEPLLTLFMNLFKRLFQFFD